jgi:putative holliday junction resolvase
VKYLGIDYGAKNIGIALSDESGKLAFPEAVWTNDRKLIDNLKKICAEQNIKAVVLGESTDFKGKANPIFKASSVLKDKIEKELKLKVFFMPEYFSTKQAERILGKNKMIDARAAAVILQSFLDKQNSQ